MFLMQKLWYQFNNINRFGINFQADFLFLRLKKYNSRIKNDNSHKIPHHWILVWYNANTSNGTTHNYSFNVSSSDTVTRVSLNWLRYSTLSGTHTSATPTLGTLADLDLRVYDKNGALVKSAITSNNNTEIVEFTPNTALSPYKIEVKQYNGSDRIVYYTVSWY